MEAKTCQQTSLVTSARLADLSAESAQKALASLKAAGRSLATCNHHRAAIKVFSKWCDDTHRLRDDPLRGVKGYNAKEDRRHDRRTISLDKMQRLIVVTEQGPAVLGIFGPTRALCYRLAVATGLRYSEIGSITPESFDWKAPTVRVKAGYTKNGQEAVLPLPDDLAADLAAYVARLNPSLPVFPSPKDKGAEMLQADLAVAGIEYVDASGLFFDFHSLRCQTATLADAAGVSPRVVQKLMRHSTLELTGRYTRPRVVDIEAAASMVPSLKPEGNKPEATAMQATGTDGNLPHYFPTAGDVSSRNVSVPDVMASSEAQFCMEGESLKNKASDVSCRVLSATVGNTGDGTRTHDLRIMRPPL
jgi:integrase